MADAASSPSTTRLVFMGSPEFALPSLQRLLASGYNAVGVYTQPDRGAGRGRRLQPSPVKVAALEAGLPVFQPESLRRQEAIDELAALQPDVMVVVAYGQILRRAVLQLPPRGVLNVHPSLLPRYRGASPVATAILDGVETTGITIMLLDEGMDTGPILAQQIEAIRPEDTTGTLSDRLATLGAELLSETLRDWLDGQITPRPQNDGEATLTRRIQKEDGQLDWSQPATELWRQIRSSTPWPAAVTTLGDATLQILQAWPLTETHPEEPGTILPFRARIELPAALPAPAFAVQTGDGILLPLILRRAGRKAVTAREFLNGERDLLGRRLGA